MIRHAAALAVRPAAVLLVASALTLAVATGAAPHQLGQPTVASAPSPLATFDAAWQAIRETYVEDARSDEDWRRLHDEFRARAAAAGDDAALRPVLQDLLVALGRSHYELVPGGLHNRMSAAEGTSESGDAGLELTTIDGRIVISRVDETSASYERGIRPGWIVDVIDGTDLNEISSTHPAGSPARAFRLWAAATAFLRGPVGSTVRLQLRDGADRVVALAVPRRRQAGEAVKFGHLPTFFARLDERWLSAPGGAQVAYIHFNVWMTPLAGALDRALTAAGKADGVILDLRRNPGGVLTMLMGVSGYFLTQPVSLGTVRTREAELRLTANPRFARADGTPVQPFEGKLAILLDASSYSASEIFAGGMQALGRARVFGTPSPGGALPAMLRRLPNGDILEYAIGDFVTARGDRIEGRGVTPDQVVPLTRDALLTGADPPLAAALAWMRRDASSRP